MDNIDSMFGRVKITLRRDKRDINYRQSIKEFMQTVRESDFVLMIISDSYLKSVNCMYEMLEFIKDTNYKERILPLIMNDTKLFNPLGRLEYIKYWQQQEKELRDQLQYIDGLNAIDLYRDLKKIEETSRNIGEFLAVISDMNNLIIEENIKEKDFDTILKVIGAYPTNDNVTEFIPKQDAVKKNSLDC